jgi:hypothetical protein
MRRLIAMIGSLVLLPLPVALYLSRPIFPLPGSDGIEVRAAAPRSVRESLELPTTGRILRPHWPEGLDEILVTRDGDTWFGGAKTTIEDLRDALAVVADRRRDLHHPYQPSMVPALLRIDSGAPWTAASRTIEALASPDVRICELAVAARSAIDGAEALFSIYLDESGGPRWDGEGAAVWLTRSPAAAKTTVVFEGTETGSGEQGLQVLRRLLILRFGLDASRRPRLRIEGEVPWGEVVRVLDLLHPFDSPQRGVLDWSLGQR